MIQDYDLNLETIRKTKNYFGNVMVKIWLPSKV